MEITLVTSIMNDEIHGTDNDKKTGCGINLQKSDNVNKYRRGGKTVDLKEITCERCKNAFAKKMIKADKKEMARMLKEERQREKAGLADEGIVDLGGRTARITSVKTATEPEPKPVPVENTSVPEKEEPKQTIAGTGVALDSGLAAFNITPPPAEEPAPSPQKDDFLAQFSVQKPQPEEEEKTQPAPAVNNIQDDFLAQFSVSVPAQEEQNEQEEIQSAIQEEPEESIDFSEINPPPSAYEEPDEIPAETDEKPVGIIDEDDIMKMFAFGNVKPSSSQSPAVDDSNYNYVAPADEESEYIPEPVAEEIPENNDIAESSDWDYVANKLFGIENSEQSVTESVEEKPVIEDIELPTLEDVIPVQEEHEYNTPIIEDLELSSLEDVTPAREEHEYTAPVFDDVELPSLEDVTPAREEHEYTAPVFDDVELPSLEDVTPAREEHEYTAPVFDDVELPSLEDVTSIQEEPEYIEPVAENSGFPSLDEMSSIIEQEEISEEIDEVEETEEVSEEISEENYTYQEQQTPVQQVAQSIPVQQMASPVQPAIQPMATPVQPIPQPVPVQPAYQQPVYQQPVYPQQPVYAQQPMIGQVVNVPQFKGYDQNNQPVYTYVQMQLTGYSANGQPIYMPFGQTAMQQPVVQPVPQPVPVTSPVPKKPVIPEQHKNENQPLTPGQKIAAAAAAKGGMPASAANISKIAVHEHSRSTSQAFISAIAESKEYASKSLTETQGVQSRKPVFDSIEDILSSMGDDSEKKKRQQQESMKRNVPVYQEYTAQSAPVMGNVPKPKKPAEPQRPLTKAELREKKKQEKIDAKFKKDLAKKGF